MFFEMLAAKWNRQNHWTEKMSKRGGEEEGESEIKPPIFSKKTKISKHMKKPNKNIWF